MNSILFKNERSLYKTNTRMRLTMRTMSIRKMIMLEIRDETRRMNHRITNNTNTNKRNFGMNRL